MKLFGVAYATLRQFYDPWATTLVAASSTLLILKASHVVSKARDISAIVSGAKTRPERKGEIGIGTLQLPCRRELWFQAAPEDRPPP